MYKKIIRPLLFRLEPEQAHHLTLQAMRFASTYRPLKGLVSRLLGTHQTLKIPVEAFGLKFSNPVGLAAGYDKDGIAWKGLSALGFGHIEIGTVTPHPQSGNPKPRVFRIPAEGAVINRMGFPGRGADYLSNMLLESTADRADLILGVNIGKNKDTPNEEATLDYVQLLETFSLLADYVAVNVSSPNTVGLRRLQARKNLEYLLQHLKTARLNLQIKKPILVKISPDLDDAELDDALDAILTTGMDGIIATNTTVARKGLKSVIGDEAGGLSGTPLTDRSRKMVALIHKRTNGKLPIVGVGGIMTSEDASRMLDAGATLVQVFTGLIYAGPCLVTQICERLSVSE